MFKVGDSVKHNSYGRGVILELDGVDPFEMAFVSFKNFNTKVYLDTLTFVQRVESNAEGGIDVVGEPIDITEDGSGEALPEFNGNIEREWKPTNPKDAIGCDKLPLHLWPTTATAMGCLGLLEGALKYGRKNFRESGVRTSIYIDACKRHLDAYMEGEDHAPDSGTPHLANALACLAIIVDAQAAGKLDDDRNYNGSGYRKLVDNLTPHVRRLKDLFADKKPKHYTIEDKIK